MRSPYPPYKLVNPAATTPRGRGQSQQRRGARLASPHSDTGAEDRDCSPLAVTPQHPSEQRISGGSLVPGEWSGEGGVGAKALGGNESPEAERGADAVVAGLRLALARGDSPVECIRQLDLRMAQSTLRPHTARERGGARRSPRPVRPATARRPGTSGARGGSAVSRTTTPRSRSGRARAPHRGRGSSEAGAVAIYRDRGRPRPGPSYTPIRRSNADANLLSLPAEYSLVEDGGDQWRATEQPSPCVGAS